LAIALSVLSIDFYFLKPITAYALTVYDIPLIIVFCSLAIVISYLVDFRRRAENQLRQTNDELEQRVIERTAELAEANRVKDEFLAMVTHDLRAPLTSMLGWIEIIERDGLENESLARAVGVNKRNALAQSTLVSDLLDLTSMSTARIKLELEPTDLAQLLNLAKERVRPMTDAKSISFESSVPADLPIVNADANGLTRVLDNLLINAIKFTPNGGMIKLNARVEHSLAKITVSDTGDGIDAGLLPHVFEPFRQRTAHNRQGGVGLGLAIVKRIIEAHGGAVSAESAGPGDGSIFVVSLPLEHDADEITLVQKRDAGESKEPLLTRDSNLHSFH
jgi:signal transduction histidine kinase